MAKAYSMDLRERVLKDCDTGKPAAHAPFSYILFQRERGHVRFLAVVRIKLNFRFGFCR